MTKQAFNRLELVSEFREIPLFSMLDDEQLLKIVTRVTRVKLDAGEILFCQGDHAESFYLLRKGQMQLYLESPDGQEKVIDVVHGGQLFAEAVTFFEGQVYPVNAQAMQYCELLSVNINIFRGILKESVDTCFNMLAAMCRRLHVQLKEIDNLSLHNATYRLAYHFLKSVPEDAGEDTHIVLHYPKSVLASRLSIKPETLSRILAQLKHQEIIEVRGNEIVLHKIEALRNYMTSQKL